MQSAGMRPDRRGIVLDTSVVLALLDADLQVLSVWHRADAGSLMGAVPAGVILDVSRARRVTAGEWAPLLWSETISVPALSETVATEIGAWSGDLGVRHALWESRSLGWPILTRQSGGYGPDADLIEV